MLPDRQAARRRAITELLFFSSVGDLRRCQRICQMWNLEVCGGGAPEGRGVGLDRTLLSTNGVRLWIERAFAHGGVQCGDP